MSDGRQPEEVVLVHPDLPEVEYTTNALHARVLAASGWEPKPEPEPEQKKPARPARPSPAAASESTRTIQES